MDRRKLLFGIAALGVAGCANDPSVQIGASGIPAPRAYIIDPANTANVQFRMLDAVNSIRQAAGVGPVQLNAKLNAAAATHSRDMSLQNRPWLFGSDGSSPLDRARRVGFEGRVLGENISESYETELDTLAAWMNQENTRAVILDPNAKDMGFSWFQETTGKLWWTLSMGGEVVTSAETVDLLTEIDTADQG